MIKIKNNRKGGSLFHYAHFICDCLFPEIMCNIFKYKRVIREKNINQTIGNFYKIYTEVMMVYHIEVPTNLYNRLKIKKICYKNKEDYNNKIYFDKFRKFIFNRYNINNLEYDNNYPEVILIKRGDRINLINDKYLQKKNTNINFIKTGKERREIKNIEVVETFLENKYKNIFKSLYFENLEFKEQVKHFNNAKLIICAHGAVMSNMFFCKEGTTIIEVTCNTEWIFFDKISKMLNLNHIKCHKNNETDIIKCIEKINIL